MLFWLIEFFLFFIFIYLTLFSPAENYYVQMSNTTNIIQFNFCFYDYYCYMMIAMACLLSQISLILVKNNNKLIFIVFAAINFCYSYVMVYEFFKLKESLSILYTIDEKLRKTVYIEDIYQFIDEEKDNESEDSSLPKQNITEEEKLQILKEKEEEDKKKQLRKVLTASVMFNSEESDDPLFYRTVSYYNVLMSILKF